MRRFVINTGDNFYWCGIQNSTDFQLAVDFEEPYADASLQIPWCVLILLLYNLHIRYSFYNVISFPPGMLVWVITSTATMSTHKYSTQLSTKIGSSLRDITQSEFLLTL